MYVMDISDPEDGLRAYYIEQLRNSGWNGRDPLRTQPVRDLLLRLSHAMGLFAKAMSVAAGRHRHRGSPGHRELASMHTLARSHGEDYGRAAARICC